jgi:hypothetical protein
VDEAAEPVAPLDGDGGLAHSKDQPLLGSFGRCKVQRAMWPVRVVVADEHAKHTLELTPIHDQEPVQAL